jgi:ATP-dependent helicase/nuclease subunit A
MTLAAYEHNGQPVTREAFYAIACDPRRSVAVEACAGAGKTWMLVSRMLRALLDGAAPHEILAITFTKKAAGEMRQRLQEWLEATLRAKPSPKSSSRSWSSRGISHSPASNGHEALQNLYRSVLAAGRPVQIRTFHSWFAALLRTAPLAVLQAARPARPLRTAGRRRRGRGRGLAPVPATVAGGRRAARRLRGLVAEHGRFADAKGAGRRAEPSGWSSCWPTTPAWWTPRCRRVATSFPSSPLSMSPPTSLTARRRRTLAGWAAPLAGAETNKTPQKAPTPSWNRPSAPATGPVLLRKRC